MARRTKEDVDATRRALLDAAEQVFYDKGVARTSLAEIALAAGTTRGAIYWHFKDKMDLFNAMVDRISLPLDAVRNADSLTDLDDPLQRVRCVVQQLLALIVNDARTRRVFEIAMYRVEYVSEFSALRERHQAALMRFRGQLAQNLELAARQDVVVLPMPLADVALGLQALFDGLLQAWILGGAGFDLCAIGAGAVDAYLRGLGFDV